MCTKASSQANRTGHLNVFLPKFVNKTSVKLILKAHQTLKHFRDVNRDVQFTMKTMILFLLSRGTY